MPSSRTNATRPTFDGESPVRLCEPLSEAAFIRMLKLEQRRTERSRRRFVLMLLELDSLLISEDNKQSLSLLLEGLTNSTRETDVVGWYQDQATIGTIFTEIGPADGRAVANALLDRFTGALSDAFSIEQLNQIRLSFHVFPDDWEQQTNGRPKASVIYPEAGVRDPADKTFALGVKRVLDVAGSLSALILSTPLFVLIALAIKCTSKGPVIFRQQRVGLYGKRFTFLKFRSMHVDNDHTRHQEFVTRLIKSTPAAPKPASTTGSFTTRSSQETECYKIMDDKRVTRVGRFLRKSSLDELPQFLNVLSGEMSLVGPRPPVPYEVEEYDIWHRRRLCAVKPGITGLWQVTARSRVGFADMVRLDLKYARSWSLWLDFKILFQTPRAVIGGNGAH